MKSPKMPLAALGVVAVQSLFVLDDNPPPFTFAKDLNLKEPLAVTRDYQESSALDRDSYWQPTELHL